MNTLWLALHLPQLPLEAHGLLPAPSAVAEQARILACDAAARAAGVKPGDGASAARAMAPGISIMPRDPAREAVVLHALACWAGSFTPRVSLTPPQALLLEIGSCQRLFGGIETLVEAIAAGAHAQGFAALFAVAPTPQAALWLAQVTPGALCLDAAALHRQLDALSVRVLPAEAAELLETFGVRRLGEARRLPADALARRIGRQALGLVASAFGEAPDPRLDFAFPECFALALELPAAVETAGALLFAARRLTAALAGWLAARQAGIGECRLRLRHREGETPLVLRFAEPTRDAARLERILRERLERLVLQAPVASLRLEAESPLSLPGRNGSLFDDAASRGEAMGTLLERLRARLGESGVRQPALRADHRPECATALLAAEPISTNLGRRALEAKAGISRQPFWLLDPPQSLPEIGGRPHRRGPLKLLAGPERIESGWWDGGEAAGDVRRDYFIALAPDARWLWIYRDCRMPGGWFLHGLFA